MAVSQTLTLTEVSVDNSSNSSQVRILWQSTQTGDSWNGYTRTAKYYVSINGGAEIGYSVDYTLPQSSIKTIVNTTIKVPHNVDGTGTIHVRTWMDTGISAGVVQKYKTLTLTTIPMASTINSVTSDNNASLSITFDKKCRVQWTPYSKSYWYKLCFEIGTWSYKTSLIHPNQTSLYTYTTTDSPIPLDAACEITGNPPKGTLKVTLYTYSDALGNQEVGSSSKTYTVTVPDNVYTKPSVAMTLSPVTPYEKFKSLYIQGRSKVKATFTGEGKYNATISSYSMQVGGKTYSSPFLSDVIQDKNTVSVVGTAIDSRGYTNTTTQTIEVIPYQSPFISPFISQAEKYDKVICERCLEDGTASNQGTCLHVKGMRNYTKFTKDGITNTCSVRCRCKPEGGVWSHGSGEGEAVLLWSDTTTDAFDVILKDILTDTKSDYEVELNIVDDTYLPVTMLFNVPSERVTYHAKAGGKGWAFGKYATHDNMFECDWDARFNGKLYHQENEVNVVIEEGTKTVTTAEGTTVTWHYRKWLNGSLECWCRRNVDVNITTAWGTGLYYGMATTINYPFEFAERPITQVTCEYGDDEVSLFVASSGTGTDTYATPVMLCRADSKTVVNCNILYNVHGKWK